MADYFYRGSPHAVKATKPEMMWHADEIKATIAELGEVIDVVAVNQYYKSCFIGRNDEGRLAFYTIINRSRIRRDYGFGGSQYDWDSAPNYVQLSELELGQLELF